MIKYDWFVPVDRNVLTNISNISGANPNKWKPMRFETKKKFDMFYLCLFLYPLFRCFPFLVHSSVVRWRTRIAWRGHTLFYCFYIAAWKMYDVRVGRISFSSFFCFFVLLFLHFPIPRPFPFMLSRVGLALLSSSDVWCLFSLLVLTFNQADGLDPSLSMAAVRLTIEGSNCWIQSYNPFAFLFSFAATAAVSSTLMFDYFLFWTQWWPCILLDF